jgi:hypothetical protein
MTSRGRAIVAHAVTHAHPDHDGSSRAVSRRLDLPFWCPAGDADAVESRRLAHSESIRRLAALQPALALFGHRPPLRDPAAWRRFAARLSVR